VLAEVEHNSPLSTYYIRISNHLEVTVRHEVGKMIVIKSNLFIPQEIKVSFTGTEYAIEYMDYKLLVLDLSLGEHLAILTLPLVPETSITITWDEKDILKNRVEAILELAGIRDILDISTAWSVKEQSYEIDLRSSFLTGPTANIAMPLVTRKAGYGTIAGQDSDAPLKLVPEVAIRPLIGAGKELTNVINTVTTVRLKPVEEPLINDVLNWMIGLSHIDPELDKLITKSYILLDRVRIRLLSTKQETLSMAEDTIVGVNDLIEEILKIGPDSTKEGEKLVLTLEKFHRLLEDSRNTLYGAQKNYDAIFHDLNQVRATLSIFSYNIMEIAKKFKFYNAYIEHMKKIARDGFARAKEIEAVAEKCSEYLILLKRWDRQIHVTIDEFDGDFDFIEFLNKQGKPEIINLLCDLSSRCKIKMELQLQGSVPETEWEWEMKSKSWSDAQCPNIKQFPGLTTLQQCKEHCELRAPTCTAINWNLKGHGCVLRGCSFPAPQPQSSYVGFIGYRRNILRTSLKKLTPIDAKMPDVWSSSDQGTLSARNCIDGEIPHDKYGLCHTGVAHTCPWIAIDLGSSMTVNQVVIYNRKDCCGERTRNVHILVSSEVPTDASTMTNKGQLLGKFLGPAINGERIEVSSAVALRGRFVIVQMDLAPWAQNGHLSQNSENYLNLQEVEVYGPIKRGSLIPAQHPRCDIRLE